MTNAPTSLAGYQNWLNTIKQWVQLARLRVALAANRELIKVYATTVAASFGQQSVDQMQWVHRHVKGYAS